MFELTPYSRHNVTRYNPFREFEEIEKALFGAGTSFSTDIRDTGNSYTLEADLPGFKKEDIHIDLKDGLMTISAERRNENEKKDKNDNVIYSERSYGSFSRSFDVSGINDEDISAEYTDGVLKVVMPKKAETVPASRRLEIK